MIVKIGEDKGFFNKDFLSDLPMIALVLAMLFAFINLPKGAKRENDKFVDSIVEQVEEELGNVENNVVKNGGFSKEDEFELSKSVKEISSNVHIDEITEEDGKLYISMYYSGKNMRGNEIVRKDIFKIIDLEGENDL